MLPCKRQRLNVLKADDQAIVAPISDMENSSFQKSVDKTSVLAGAKHSVQNRMCSQLNQRIQDSNNPFCTQFVRVYLESCEQSFRAAPGSDLERPRRQAGFLEHIDVLPIVEIVRVRTMVRHDENLDSRRTRLRKNFAEVAEHARRVGSLFDGVVELSALTHEIVVGIDDKKRGAVSCVCVRSHDIRGKALLERAFRATSTTLGLACFIFRFVHLFNGKAVW
jgi:hypothetical protein